MLIFDAAGRAHAVRDVCPTDKALAADHEAGHSVVARELGARASAAYIWENPASNYWLGEHRYADRFDLSPISTRLLALSGAVGEALRHGITNPIDIAGMASLGDIRLMGIDGIRTRDDLAGAEFLAGDVRWLRHRLGGDLRHVWRDSSRLLRARHVVGDHLALRDGRPPAGWCPP